MQAETPISRETVSAGLIERLAAYLIDGVILFIPAYVLMLILPLALYLVASIAIGIAYAAYFWTTTGSTPGKMIMGLKVVRADGSGLLDTTGAITRYVGYWVSALPIGLGFLWAIWDPKHDAWHDKIAGTKVIKFK
jgi:uncharacterized RDD family membrane protein YckC